jgi:hypothetical protein
VSTQGFSVRFEVILQALDISISIYFKIENRYFTSGLEPALSSVEGSLSKGGQKWPDLTTSWTPVKTLKQLQ